MRYIENGCWMRISNEGEGIKPDFTVLPRWEVGQGCVGIGWVERCLGVFANRQVGVGWIKLH